MAGVERRLAAILSADAVSYSRLVASDDAGTLRHMARIRAIVEEAVRECGGRVVDARGDNLLAEFSSASSAVTAAMQAQERLEAQERPLPEAERLRLRMGVHLGDVVEEDTLAGDAVNIAARIEALAEPGGVCVSDVVAGQVMRRAPYSFERLGPRRLKNIPGRVVVYRVGPPGTAPTARPRRVRRLLAAGCAAAVLAAIPIAMLGRSTALQPPAVLDALAESPRAAPTTAIAVLPFANLSSDPDQEFFSDGLTEELISQLAGVAALQVAARTSSFAFKGRELDIRRIAAELGVGSVVEGSVRREGGRLRVTAQLIQADDGFHLWASSYERSAQEVFAIQEEIAQSITGTLRVLLTGVGEATETAQATSKGLLSGLGSGAGRSRPVPPAGDLEAYELYLRGTRHWLEPTEAGFRESIHSFERALELDPDFAGAWAGLADALTGLWDHGYDTREEVIARAEKSARHSLALDEGLAEGHVALAYALRARGAWPQAREAAERALEIRPSWARARVELAETLVAEGRLSEGIEQMSRAVQLDPLASGILRQQGRYLLYAGRPEEALVPLWRSLQLNPDDPLTKIWLWQTYQRMGRVDESREALVLLSPRPVRPLARAGVRLFGERQAIRAIVNASLALRPGRCGQDPYATAFWLAWIDESDRMFTCLEEAASRKSGRLAIPEVEPVFEPYRTDPRYRALFERSGEDGERSASSG